ncbi:PEP-CTERM sorting domain-containing protein [Roseateles chitosanitabidus]|uniref:PEP-CTERM sorting domain-containing protein n=1 Tax=Roseateles chitosanitabidus TaxID=65048 RepID=UPI0008375BCD|nr:PEP-CTERM sorting domain-containing protein [Roseateles chitosanitabidus]
MSTRFKRFKNIWLPVAMLALGAATSAQAAAVYNEGGSDVGELITTAAPVSGAGTIDAIRGTLGGGVDAADLFAIYLTAGTAFSATTTASGFTYNAFDTVLFLFDAAGKGLFANDDDGDFGGSQSTIANFIPSVSGLYYLAITGAGYTPVSGGAGIFPSLLGTTGNVAANAGAGPLTGWNSVTSEFGDYEIVLTGAQAAVPEPGSLLLVGAALGAAGLIRRRKAAPAAVNA